jgi:hypothetical protein
VDQWFLPDEVPVVSFIGKKQFGLPTGMASNVGTTL